MHDNDFDKDIKAALDDIVDTAPEPQKLSRINRGFALLQRQEPRSWYRRGGAAFLGAAAATLIVVGIAAFIGSGLGGTDADTPSTAAVAQSIESLRGIWVLDNYTTGGETHPGALSAEGWTAPWIEFTAESVEGFSGCNAFRSFQPPQITHGRLILGEVLMNAGGCLEPTPEPIIVEVIWSDPDGVAVEITATTMQLTTATSTLVFERRDRRPVSIRDGWGVQADDLACADGVVLDHRLLNPDATIEEMLTAVPSVVSVEEKGEFEYSVGYDAGGAAVATVIAGDIEPRQYHRASCAILWGIRSEANLGGAVSTWVDDLGLSQAATDVWSERFVEACGTNTGDLGPLAQRYLSEDAGFSLWAGGALPPADRATATLEAIWRTVCAASSFEEPSPMSTTGVQASCGGALFDLAYAEGPQLTTDEFLATPQGQILDAFFVDGQGEREFVTYQASDGFSIVDENLILGYAGRSIISDFELDGSDIRGWGSCNPRLTIDDLNAERWSVAGSTDPDMTTIPILVQGGACVDGTRIVTEIIEIEVQERADSVLITAWTRNIPPPSTDGGHDSACLWVGIELDAEAVLSQPLDDRTLLDAGMVPPGASSTTDALAGAVHVGVAFGVADFETCADVTMYDRTVNETDNLLEAAFAALVSGPTPSEDDQGASSWFSEKTASSLSSVALVDGLLTVDFHSVLPSIISNASTTCGSENLLAELNTTAFQFHDVARVTYELEGSCEDFFYWLQRDCQVYERP